MGKWFGQASEIEELHAENQRLKQQVATLEARLRAAYADAGVTALAGSSSPAPEAAIPQAAVPAFSAGVPNPATASFPELSAAELDMVAAGRKIAAIQSYKGRTGVDLKTAKAAIDAVPKAPSAGLELTSAELDLVAAGELFSAVKAYKDRTGVDLRTAKATIDAAR
ncbi:50S ribosomal protein L7/L12 [uncultured Actinomyces sp.]|uniref:50S ribosomal protein L7/L12 n=1 Tax=uncultured Actinomyces sp. TaxID=249061 RepID=UPI0028ED06D2|nr:50S ribosomal protein L7/L12 [uncultured Actinomyces sp.]